MPEGQKPHDLVVKKFGGTSLADVQRIAHVAQKIYEAWQSGQRSVIVVSAMAGTTNTLAGWIGEMKGVHENFFALEDRAPDPQSIPGAECAHHQNFGKARDAQGDESSATHGAVSASESEFAQHSSLTNLWRRSATSALCAEMDTVLCSGEIVTAGLLAIALQKLGLRARS